MKDARAIKVVKFIGHGDFMEMGREEKENISGSRILAVWMLLPLIKRRGI